MSAQSFARQVLVLCAALVTLVAPAAAVTVTVAPRAVTISPTGSQPFSATVEGAGTTAAVVWTVEESDGGTVDSSGLYRPPSGFGTFHLRATSVEDPVVYDTATIDVAPIGMTITPVSASLATGASQLFKASVSAPSGVSNDVTWSVVGGGSENSGGRPSKVTVFTAPAQAGTSQLIATSVADPSVQATATIAIRSLVLAPQAVTISPTGRVQFQVSAPGDIHPAVVWSIEEADGGTISGAGLYTPPAHAGLFHVRATSAASSTNYDVASVDVEPITVSVSPPTADLAAGGNQLFSSTVTAPAGVDTNVVWSLSGGGQQSSGNTPSKVTVFTAPAIAGTSTLVATSVADPSVQASATIHVRSVVVSPRTATVTPTGSLQFAASDGGGAPAVAWTVVETGGGSISGSGLYTPPPAFGTYHVQAARLDDPTNYDRAAVTVQPIGVTISPISALVLTDGSQLFTATVSAPVGVSRNVTWSLSGVGALASAGPSKQTAYTAPPTPGSATLVATSVADPTIRSQATITVSEAVVAISPSATALLPGGIQTFAATVTGAANSGVTWRIVEGSAVGGRLSSSTATSVVYTAPAAFGTYHLEATSVADPRKKALAAIDVGRILSVAVSPASASLSPLGTQVFSAVVAGAGSFTNAVRWTATGGMIDPATGAYTAPAAGGTFLVRATSVQDPTKFADATVEVQITIANRPPVLTVPGPRTVNEGVSLSFTVSAADADGDALSYSVTGLPAGASFDAATRAFSWTPGFAQAGTYTVTFTATDNGTPNLSDTRTVTTTVIDVNRAPALTVPGPQTVDEGVSLSFTVSAADADGDALSYSVTGLPAGASFDTATRAFSWTPGFAQAGTYSVTFTATDNGTPNLSDTKTVTITVIEANRAPALTVPGPRTVDEEVNLSFAVSAADADGDALSYSVTGLPAGASFDAATRAFSWTPGFAQAGTYTVTFTATDNGTPNLSDTRTVTITVIDVNRAPALTVPGPQTVDEGVNLSFTVSAADADGDALSYSVTGLPAGASFDAATRAFSWTPGFAQAGTYTVTFTATDNGTPNLSDTRTVTITVIDVNRAPALTVPGPQTVDEGVNLSFTVSAADADGDALSYSVTGLPAGASFDAATRAFSWTPGFAQAGTYTVTFTATDNGMPNLSDTKTVTTTVIDVPSLSVVLTGMGSGTVTSSPAGISCGAICNASFTSGTLVTLTAAPAPGSTFAGWSGAGCSGIGACTIVLSASLSVSATFDAMPPAGGCGEASCVPAQGTYISHFSGPGCTGTESYYLPYDGYAYSCRTWDGDGQCGTIQRTVTNYSVRINGGPCEDLWPEGNTLSEFVTVYRGGGGSPTSSLSVGLTGTGSGTVTSSPAGISCGAICNASFTSGTVVTLTAAPAPGSTFAGWSGAGCSGIGACTIVLSASLSVSATFDAMPPAGGCGEASCVPAQDVNISHFSGPGCTGTEFYYLPYDLYAYSCRTWDGDGQCGTIQRTVTNYSVRINGGPCEDLWPDGNTLSEFVTVYRGGGGSPTSSLSVGLTGTGSGTVTSSPAGISCGAICNASFTSGTVVTLTAAPAPGSTFAGWSGAGCSGIGACTIVLSASLSVSATFDAMPPAGGCGEASCVPAQGMYISHFSGPGCTGTESYYLPYDGYAFSCRTWDGDGQCGTIQRTVTNYSARINGGPCEDLWPEGNTLSEFVTVYRGGGGSPTSSLSVGLTGTGSGTVTSSPAGISCGAICSASFTSGSLVTLTAAPAPGSTFAGWSGTGCSGIGACTVILSASQSVSATFDAMPDGGDCGEASCVPAQGIYISHFSGPGCTGTESYYLPYDGYAFSCRTWDGDGQCGTIQRTVTNYSVRINGGPCEDLWPEGNTLSEFVTVYRGGGGSPTSSLSVGLTGTGSGTVTSSPAGISCGAICNASFTSGTVVTLTAAPAPGSTFAGWSGAGCSGIGACTIVLSASLSVSATFDAMPPAGGCGEASCVPAQGTYISHFSGPGCTGTESYYLPYDGYAFSCRTWDGDGQCGTIQRTVTNYSVRINGGPCEDLWPDGNTLSEFVTVYRGGGGSPTSSLSVILTGTGSGTVTSSPAGISCGAICNASFTSGTLVTLTAAPAPGSTFAGWSGGGCSGIGACTIVLSASLSVSATFDAMPPAGGCGEASCVPAQGMYISHFSGPGCTGTESYYLPYDGYAYSCRTWDGDGQCGTIQRTVTNYSVRINGGPCEDLWPDGNTLSEFVTVYRGGGGSPTSSLSVGLTGTGSGTVTSSPAGISCGAICNASFTSGTVVTLTAAPAPGSTFAGWSGAGCSGIGACTIVLSASLSVSATFDAMPPAGGCGEASCVPAEDVNISHFSGPGCTGTEFYYLPYDLYAYSCRTWDGNGQCGTLQRTVTYYSARINGGPCQDLWPEGNTLPEFVTVYRGGGSLPTSSLGIVKIGTGSGTVASRPAGITCGAICNASFTSGTLVTLTTASAPGSTFTGWNGGGCSGIGACTVALSASLSVSASFDATPSGDGCGEASCVPAEDVNISHFSGPGCTGTESYYLPYDGYAYSCRTWDGDGQCGTIQRTVTNYSVRINGGPCEDLWPDGNTLSEFVTVYR